MMSSFVDVGTSKVPSARQEETQPEEHAREHEAQGVEATPDAERNVALLAQALMA